jgi:hypothetical protein
MKNMDKRISRITRLLLSIAVLAYSSLLQFSLPSIVLCFGDDGHIAFEQSGDNFKYDETEDSGDHPIHKHKNLSHQEDDCQDISLMTVLSNLYLKKDGKIKLVKLAAVLARINTKNTDLVSHFNQDKEATIIHSSTKCLQTVILLI